MMVQWFLIDSLAFNLMLQYYLLIILLFVSVSVKVFTRIRSPIN